MDNPERWASAQAGCSVTVLAAVVMLAALAFDIGPALAGGSEPDLKEKLDQLQRRFDALEAMVRRGNLDRTGRRAGADPQLQATISPPPTSSTAGEETNDVSPEALYQRGEAAWQLRRYGEARRQFERLIRRFPDHQRAWLARHRLLDIFEATGTRDDTSGVLASSVAKTRRQPAFGPDGPGAQRGAKQPCNGCTEKFRGFARLGPVLPIDGLGDGGFKSAVDDRVFFAPDSARLDGRATSLLREQAKWLLAHPASRARIEGHADEVGTRSYNLAMGERRAVAAKRILVEAGVRPERISIVSLGRERPVAICRQEACARQNRRAVTVITVSGGNRNVGFAHRANRLGNRGLEAGAVRKQRTGDGILLVPNAAER